MILGYLKILAGIATILTGMVSLFFPTRVPGFTGIEPIGGRGITEIRTILGALFVGLGGAVLYYNTQEAYVILGITYLAMTLARGISIFVDDSKVRSNWISLGVELVFGVLLIL